LAGSAAGLTAEIRVAHPGCRERTIWPPFQHDNGIAIPVGPGTQFRRRGNPERAVQPDSAVFHPHEGLHHKPVDRGPEVLGWICRKLVNLHGGDLSGTRRVCAGDQDGLPWLQPGHARPVQGKRSEIGDGALSRHPASHRQGGANGIVQAACDDRLIALPQTADRGPVTQVEPVCSPGLRCQDHALPGDHQGAGAEFDRFDRSGDLGARRNPSCPGTTCRPG
jgi:hypothetical protein